MKSEFGRSAQMRIEGALDQTYCLGKKRNSFWKRSEFINTSFVLLNESLENMTSQRPLAAMVCPLKYSLRQNTSEADVRRYVDNVMAPRAFVKLKKVKLHPEMEEGGDRVSAQSQQLQLPSIHPSVHQQNLRISLSALLQLSDHNINSAYSMERSKTGGTLIFSVNIKKSVEPGRKYVEN